MSRATPKAVSSERSGCAEVTSKTRRSSRRAAARSSAATQAYALAVAASSLLLLGIGVGAMLTSSVNVVQSAFPELVITLIGLLLALLLPAPRAAVPDAAPAQARAR